MFTGHHSDSGLISHYQFVRRLWAFMSHLPLNRDCFVPHPAFPAVFGQELTASLGYPIKWPDLRVLLQEHVHFHTSLLGVFSGRKLKM